MFKPEAAAGFDQAASFLPPHLRRVAETLGIKQRAAAEEIRMRSGYPVSVLQFDGEYSLGHTPVTPADIETLLEIATGASAYAREETVKKGYVTVKGGHRIGICGRAVMKDGEICGQRSLTSAAIRVAREHIGVAEGVFDPVAHENIIIVAPPGYGKTSLLRDLIRIVSKCGTRVSLADERGEVAACVDGRPQMNVGKCTDVLTGAPKAEAALMLLKTMNPQVIAVDEITSPEDVKALLAVINCGVRVFATAHAEDVREFMSRTIYRPLVEQGVFRWAATISAQNGRRIYGREKLC